MCSSDFTTQVKILYVLADSFDNFVSKYVVILFICPVPSKVKKTTKYRDQLHDDLQDSCRWWSEMQNKDPF
jgi:hypothetical protein